MRDRIDAATWLADRAFGEVGAEGGIRTHTPLRILRPERSASTVPPLRLIVLMFLTDTLVVGDRGLEPLTSCV